VEIVLIRHGRPIIDTSGKISAAEFGMWVSEYDMAGIDENHKPEHNAIDRAERCAFTVCSHLRRSIESARLLNIEAPGLVSPLFRECEMPHGNWRYPKLSKTTWSVLFRLFQLVGYSSNAESYRDIKVRSEKCANQLVALSLVHHSILFVGHGTLNWLIHKHLLRLGWLGPNKSGRKHWEYGEYVYNAG